MPNVYVIKKFGPNPYPDAVEVDTTSHGSFKDLSPFYLPGGVHDGVNVVRFENLWQYTKVYADHVDGNDMPNAEYYAWRNAGWANNRAIRYPMGKGAKPMYSWWNGQCLTYVAARKAIYIPYYADAVIKTASYAKLYGWLVAGHDIVLRDFDGYDYIRKGLTLQQVADDPYRSMGHAFVIAMLLTGSLVMA